MCFSKTEPKVKIVNKSHHQQSSSLKTHNQHSVNREAQWVNNYNIKTPKTSKAPTSQTQNSKLQKLKNLNNNKTQSTTLWNINLKTQTPKTQKPKTQTPKTQTHKPQTYITQKSPNPKPQNSRPRQGGMCKCICLCKLAFHQDCMSRTTTGMV